MITALLLSGVLLQAPNTLTAQEVRDGWRLLFDGRSTRGWHNFKTTGVRPGWVVADGVLTCADPSNAGDIVTDDTFAWFELSLEARLTKGGNSGIMFHVQDSGEATWHSGPEVQLYDHPRQAGVETTGYLYQLYQPPAGVDAVKPAGEWNHLLIRIAPDMCSTHVNGVKYYEFKLHSPDFWARVAKSKFAKYPQFARATSGSIAIQGDHGVVSFRNVKIRRLLVPGPGAHRAWRRTSS